MLSRRSTLHLGRIAGIPIGVQPLWLVIVGLITWALGHDFFPSEAPGISGEYCRAPPQSPTRSGVGAP